MRLLVLSDIHANLEALEAVLGDAGTAERVLFLGDLVGYGPDPNECVERVRALPALTALVGNHDLAALGLIDLNAFNPVARAAARWTDRVLSPESRAYLENLSPIAACEDYLLAHGSPKEPVWEYLETHAQARESFRRFGQAVCFVGHTHVPRVLEEGGAGNTSVPAVRPGHYRQLPGEKRLIVNPGGVGQPRDGDPRAAYGIWDTESGLFEFRRVAYPVAETQRKILAAGLPSQLAARLLAGL